MKSTVETLLVAEYAAAFGIACALVWFLGFRSVPIGKAKDRMTLCLLQGSALYIFVGLTIVSIWDWKILGELITKQFAQGEIIAIFFVASYEAFSSLWRVCTNTSTLGDDD